MYAALSLRDAVNELAHQITLASRHWATSACQRSPSQLPRSPWQASQSTMAAQESQQTAGADQVRTFWRGRAECRLLPIPSATCRTPRSRPANGPPTD